VALVFDKSDNLYVVNCNRCFGSGKARGNVVEYAPGTQTPFRTIDDGLDTPMATALGQQGFLFVANAPSLGKGSITVYSSGPKPIRTITEGIDGPIDLAIGPDGNLYVANEKGNTVAVYSRDGSQLLRTIRKGMQMPLAIAIGKE
jgi:DNA-binding beta-propeller fold protein YncE